MEKRGCSPLGFMLYTRQTKIYSGDNQLFESGILFIEEVNV